MPPRELGGIFPLVIGNFMSFLGHDMSRLSRKLLEFLLLGAVFVFGSVAFAQTLDYSPLVGTEGYTDFRNKNAPGSAAVVGISGVATIRTKHDGLTLQKVKIFVPPGAMRLRVSLTTYATDQDARAAARFGNTPVSAYGDVLPETSVNDTRPTLRNLLAGQELKFYSPGRSGVLMVANSESTDLSPSTTGGYIYLNFLSIPGSQILSFSTYLDVKADCYSNWHANATWDGVGNPSESAAHTCAGSNGGDTGGGPDNGGNGGEFTFAPEKLVVGSVEATTITPATGTTLPAVCTASSAYVVVIGNAVKLSWQKGSIKAPTSVDIKCGSFSKALMIHPAGGSTGTTLTGIGLSSDSLVVGSSSSVTVAPLPAAATLPACTVPNTGNLKISGASITLGANASGLTNQITEKVTCGAFSKDVTIKLAGSVANVATQVITGTDGKLTLRLTLNQPPANVSAGVTTSVWVGAYLPAGAVFMNEAVWFFKTPTSWREIEGIDINSLAFSRNQATAARTVYEVPLGLTAADLRPFNIEIYFGYANSNGLFTNLGKVWSGK